MKTQLGIPTQYEERYNPALLDGVPRALGREIIPTRHPFHGVDIWNAYEISWLNPKGKPQNAIGEFHIPCTSPNLIESKSFKLYLNSFNQEKYESQKTVMDAMHRDLSKCAGAQVEVRFSSAKDVIQTQTFDGICLDDLDVELNSYNVDPNLLKSVFPAKRDLFAYGMTNYFTTLFKSNCLVTSQPDWAHIQIKHAGGALQPESLFKYLMSYRKHQGFHEHCVENIYRDIMNKCKPEKLTIYARFTRRGGLDINPFRSNFEAAPKNIRNSAQ